MSDRPPAPEYASSAQAGGSRRPELSPQVSDKKPVIIAGVAIVLLLAIFIGALYFLAVNDAARIVLRDVSLIMLALVALLIFVVLLVLVLAVFYIVLKINDIFHLLHHEVQPTLSKVDQLVERTRVTAEIVQNRTNFISDEAVKPVVQVVSAFAALKAILRTLFKRL